MSVADLDRDRRFMAIALELAARGDYATSPNPMVGCVIVQGDVIVGRGFHRRAGEAHAEVEALADAGERARGADVYVTLEPCSHSGRTPPCADALIAAGVRRCVVAVADQNPLVCGEGVRRLEAAGVDVVMGVLEVPARQLNEFFLTRMTTGRPFVTAKFAASLDGKMATRTGASRWISSPESRRHAHRLRHIHDAILVGVGTILADDPALTTRDAEGDPAAPRSPLRVILDSGLRTPPGARVLDTPGAMIVAGPGVDTEREKALRARGAETLVVPRGEVGLDIAAVLGHLSDRGCLSVLVEGGAAVLGSCFDARIVDKVVAYLAPRVIGGSANAVAGAGVADLSEPGRLQAMTVERRGDDIVVSGYCVR